MPDWNFVSNCSFYLQFANLPIQAVNFFYRMECCEDAVKINYEVRKRSKSKVQNYEIVEAVKEYLTLNPTSHAVPSFFKEAVGLNQAAVEFLRQNVSEINICEGNGFTKLPSSSARIVTKFKSYF